MELFQRITTSDTVLRHHPTSYTLEKKRGCKKLELLQPDMRGEAGTSTDTNESRRNAAGGRSGKVILVTLSHSIITSLSHSLSPDRGSKTDSRL